MELPWANQPINQPTWYASKGKRTLTPRMWYSAISGTRALPPLLLQLELDGLNQIAEKHTTQHGLFYPPAAVRELSALLGKEVRMFEGLRVVRAMSKIGNNSLAFQDESYSNLTFGRHALCLRPPFRVM